MKARRAMVERERPDLSIRKQCELLRVSRSGLYYEPEPTSPEQGNRRPKASSRFPGEKTGRSRIGRVDAYCNPGGALRPAYFLLLASHVLLSVAVVRNTRAPHTMGDDQLSPGIAVFQRTFDVLLQCSGMPRSEDAP